jgi:hypothetical protein
MATNNMAVRHTPHAAAEADLWEERCLRSLSTGSRAVECEPHTTLEQREARLSIRTAFDPLQFVVESLHHPIAPRLGASVGDRLRIIGQAIDKADQFLDPEARTAVFHWFNRLFPSRLRERIDGCDRRINLTHLLNEGPLVFCVVFRSSNEGEGSGPCGKYFGQCHRLSADGLSRMRAQLLKHSLHGARGSCISLCHDLLIQPSRLPAPLIPPTRQIGDVRINQVMGMVPSQTGRGLDLAQGCDTHCDG